MSTFEISRRNLFLASSAVAGGLAIPQIMTETADAAVPPSDAKTPGFQTFPAGGFRDHHLARWIAARRWSASNLWRQSKAGNRRRIDEAQTSCLKRKSSMVLHAASDQYRIGTRPRSIPGLEQAAGRMVLGKLEANMKAAGYTPDQVTHRRHHPYAWRSHRRAHEWRNARLCQCALCRR